MLLEETIIACPYCGEQFSTAIDVSAGDQQYIEDCYVCCRPILFHIEVDPEGNLIDLHVRRDDE